MKITEKQLRNIIRNEARAALTEARSPHNKYSLKFLLEAEGEAETPPIDPEAFANEVARIVMNADTLIDLKGKILKRVEQFVLKRYDQATLDKVMQSLETNFGISDEEPKSDLPPEPTFAVGASASAAGGA